jgi:hypothetical protein
MPMRKWGAPPGRLLRSNDRRRHPVVHISASRESHAP